MGGTLLTQSSSSYDRAFSELAAPHLVVVFDGRALTRDQVAATASAPRIISAAGPWLVASVAFEKGAIHLSVNSSFSSQTALSVLGRDSPGGSLDRTDVVRGRWVQAVGEIVVTRAFADQNSLSLGDRLTALSTTLKPILTVVGEAVDVDPRPDRAWVSSNQVTSLIPAGAAPLYQMSYRLSLASSKTEILAALRAVKASVPAGAVLGYISYLDSRDSFNFTASLVLTFLLAFAAMALASVAVIVSNVVTGAVLANYREIGIVKALGFTPRQVVGAFVLAMLIPALLAGLIAIPIGVLASKPLLDQAAAATNLPAPSPVVPGVDLLALIIGLSIVAAAASLPAWRAGQLSAVAAITSGTAPSGRWSASLHGRLGWWRLPRSLVIGIGDAFARPVRGSLTVVAILVGVATLVFASGLYAAIIKFNDLFSPASGGGYQVSVDRFSGYSDAETLRQLQGRPETAAVIGYKQVEGEIPGQPDPISLSVFRGDSARLGYQLAEGRWLAGPGEAVIGSVFNPNHWIVGQTINLLVAGEPLQVRIVGSCYCFLVVAVDWAAYSVAVPGAEPMNYLVQLRSGTNANAYVRQVSASEPDFLFPQINQTNNGGDIEGILDGMVAALALILGVIAGLGVFNALLLTMRERARDIAILKALGMTPRQVSTMVTVSAVVLGAAGAVLGVPAGVVLYNYLIEAMAHLSNFTISTSVIIAQINPLQLVAVGLAGVLVAILGASLPARWAARTSVVNVLNLE
jgi:putative ABC transport system permease protein